MPRLITDLMLQKQDTCPHWVYFDAHADKRHKARESEWSRLMFEQRLVDERTVISMRGEHETPKGKTPRTRAKNTLDLMAEGVERIYKPLLASGDWQAEPDLLERREDAASDFGPWHYVALDVRGGEKITEAMKDRACFYGEILGEMQGVRPDEGHVLTADGSLFSFFLDPQEHRLHELLGEIAAALEGKCPPPHLASACKHSPWFKECVRLAEGEGDLALLYNVKRKAVRTLRDRGFNTVAEVLAVDPEEFAGAVPELPPSLLDRLRLQARALTEKTHFVRAPYRLPGASGPSSAVGAPQPAEVFFDIEADGLRGNYDFLYGCLVRDAAGTRFEKFVSEKTGDQEAMWRAFLKWFGTMPVGTVVYHYGDHERHSLAVLEARYGGSKSLQRFRQNLVDLNEIVKESFVFPLYFYGLKEVGGYIGYRREAEITHGASTVEYYESWLATGDRAKLAAIVNYNREDCEATMVLKDWLVKEQPK